MPRQRVRDLVPKDDALPPAAQVQRFVTFYVGTRDLKEAACKANLQPEMGEKLYKNDRVRKLIDHQILLANVESAKLRAKANMLTVDRVDAALVGQIQKKDRVPPEMFKIAYGRVGLLKDGEFYIAPDPNQTKTQPGIYQRQTTARRTVTEELTRTETVVDPIFAVQEY